MADHPSRPILTTSALVGFAYLCAVPFVMPPPDRPDHFTISMSMIGSGGVYEFAVSESAGSSYLETKTIGAGPTLHTVVFRRTERVSGLVFDWANVRTDMIQIVGPATGAELDLVRTAALGEIGGRMDPAPTLAKRDTHSVHRFLPMGPIADLFLILSVACVFIRSAISVHRSRIIPRTAAAYGAWRRRREIERGLNRRLTREERRLLRGHCPACDYDLAGITDPRCPECGRSVDHSKIGVDPRRS